MIDMKADVPVITIDGVYDQEAEDVDAASDEEVVEVPMVDLQASGDSTSSVSGDMAMKGEVKVFEAPIDEDSEDEMVASYKTKTPAAKVYFDPKAGGSGIELAANDGGIKLAPNGGGIELAGKGGGI
eukprot:1878755-Pleurochrysis_carterae.AAC.1